MLLFPRSQQHVCTHVDTSSVLEAFVFTNQARVTVLVPGSFPGWIFIIICSRSFVLRVAFVNLCLFMIFYLFSSCCCWIHVFCWFSCPWALYLCFVSCFPRNLRISAVRPHCKLSASVLVTSMKVCVTSVHLSYCWEEFHLVHVQPWTMLLCFSSWCV